MPLIFLVVAVALFFIYIEPVYGVVRELQGEEARRIEALDRARELQSELARLETRRAAFTAEDLEKLGKLLPDNVDNVRLALDLDSMASAYNMRVNEVEVETEAEGEGEAVVDTGSPYRSVVLSFTVSASYENLVAFLKDVERSLRIVDVVELSFEPLTEGDVREYAISVQTYWLP